MLQIRIGRGVVFGDTILKGVGIGLLSHIPALRKNVVYNMIFETENPQILQFLLRTN